MGHSEKTKELLFRLNCAIQHTDAVIDRDIFPEIFYVQSLSNQTLMMETLTELLDRSIL